MSSRRKVPDEIDQAIGLTSPLFQNILIKSLNPLHVKLADFGLTKLLSGVTAYQVCSHYAYIFDMLWQLFQSLCGTPMYMAPEIILTGIVPSAHYDYQVDCWSVGVTMFVMCVTPVPS